MSLRFRLFAWRDDISDPKAANDAQSPRTRGMWERNLLPNPLAPWLSAFDQTGDIDAPR